MKITTFCLNYDCMTFSSITLVIHDVWMEYNFRAQSLGGFCFDKFLDRTLRSETYFSFHLTVLGLFKMWNPLYHGLWQFQRSYIEWQFVVGHHGIHDRRSALSIDCIHIRACISKQDDQFMVSSQSCPRNRWNSTELELLCEFSWHFEIIYCVDAKKNHDFLAEKASCLPEILEFHEFFEVCFPLSSDTSCQICDQTFYWPAIRISRSNVLPIGAELRLEIID